MSTACFQPLGSFKSKSLHGETCLSNKKWTALDDLSVSFILPQMESETNTSMVILYFLSIFKKVTNYQPNSYNVKRCLPTQSLRNTSVTYKVMSLDLWNEGHTIQYGS